MVHLCRATRALAASALVLSLAGCSAGVLPQIHQSGGTLPVARRLLEKGDLLNTVTLLTTYTTTQAGAADIDEALELLGRAHLRQKDFAAAQLDFERLLRDYPESDSAGSAAYLLGEALWGQSREPDFDQEFTLRALQQWMDYRRDRAGHWRNEQAQGRITEARSRLAIKLVRTGDLYLRIGHFEPARQYYQDALREYGETAVVGDALIGLAMVDARLGQRGKALTALGEIEREHAGSPLAERAARARRQVERMKEGAAPAKRRNEPNEPPPPGVPGGLVPGGGTQQ